GRGVEAAGEAELVLAGRRVSELAAPRCAMAGRVADLDVGVVADLEPGRQLDAIARARRPARERGDVTGAQTLIQRADGLQELEPPAAARSHAEGPDIGARAPESRFVAAAAAAAGGRRQQEDRRAAARDTASRRDAAFRVPSTTQARSTGPCARAD